MEWRDEGIILGMRPYGESSHVVSIFTKEAGLRGGLYKIPRHSAGKIQPGTCVSARWWARLPTHLGQWDLDPVWSLTHLLFSSPFFLEMVNSALALLLGTLPPHESQPLLYDGLYHFLQTLKTVKSSQDAFKSYIQWELLFLEGSGFGLDLEKCGVTQQKEDLLYVSPKSGRAISREAGEPYASKLFKFPQFLQGSDPIKGQEIKEALELTGYFMEKHIFSPLSLPVPSARGRLFHELSLKLEKIG